MAEKKLLLLLQLTYGNCFFICTSQITAGHNIILFPYTVIYMSISY